MKPAKVFVVLLAIALLASKGNGLLSIKPKLDGSTYDIVTPVLEGPTYAIVNSLTKKCPKKCEVRTESGNCQIDYSCLLQLK